MLIPKTALLIILSMIIPFAGCQNNNLINNPNTNNTGNPGSLNEGPNSTGALKEGPNSTGALKERLMLISHKVNGIDNPLTPDNINSIEIISKGINQSIKNIDIKQNKNLYKIKADGIDISITFDGSGNFIIKFNTEVKDLELKFNLKDIAEPAIIPLLSGLNENNLRAVIETGPDGKLTLAGGIKKDNGELDDSKVMFTVGRDENGKLLISILKPDGNKESYFLDKLEENIKNGGLISPDLVEKIADLLAEKKKIEDKVQKLSAMAAYVGDWIYQAQGRELIVNIIDQGNSSFSGNLKIDGKDYPGSGTYLPEANNEFLYIDSIYNNSKARMKIELLSPNTLGLTLVEATDKDLLIYKGIKLPLNRKLN
jgi:hypothetical protein